MLYQESFTSFAEASDAAKTYQNMIRHEEYRLARLRRDDRIKETLDEISRLQQWEQFALGEAGGLAFSASLPGFS